MPTLTIPLSADGPIVDVAIHVSGPRQSALAAAGQPVPPALLVRALIDTGDSCTVIDPSVVQQLGLMPTGTTAVHSASTAGQPHAVNQFDVGLAIREGTRLIHQRRSVPVVECDLSGLGGQGIAMLLGCDVLAGGVFIFNGAAGSLTLAF